jgi:hypothetical protein
VESSTDEGGEVDRLAAALAAIDEVNADDPFTLVFEGEERPKEPPGPTTCGAGRCPGPRIPTGGPATCGGERH